MHIRACLVKRYCHLRSRLLIFIHESEQVFDIPFKRLIIIKINRNRIRHAAKIIAEFQQFFLIIIICAEHISHFTIVPVNLRNGFKRTFQSHNIQIFRKIRRKLFFSEGMFHIFNLNNVQILIIDVAFQQRVIHYTAGNQYVKIKIMLQAERLPVHRRVVFLSGKHHHRLRVIGIISLETEIQSQRHIAMIVVFGIEQVDIHIL